MAKKKDEQLTYGQMPLPQGQNAYTRLKVNWSGLNRRQTVDTGVLSMESNISTAEAPYLTPSQSRDVFKSYTDKDHVISMFAFDGFIIVIYRHELTTNERDTKKIDGDALMIDYIELHQDENGNTTRRTHTGYVTKRINDGGKNDGTITIQAVDSETDDIQRSMVQFNVYENAADVLDGIYVKRLLLFPDKVSMYMKIKTVSNVNKMTDDTVMYYNRSDSCYYTYQVDEDGEGKFRIQPNSGEGYFMTDALDVVVKEYYNDGFEAATGTYDDGYRLSSHKWFNYDGYKPMDGLTFRDGFKRVTNGTYRENETTKYYERSGISPYTYTEAILEDGDSLAGLYVADNVAANATIGTIWKRSSGDNYPFEYTVSTENFEAGQSFEDGYYMYVGLKYYPFTQETLYKRKITDNNNNEVNISEGTAYADIKQKFVQRTVEYEDVGFHTEGENGNKALLKYHDNISELYEKVSDKEIKVYYRRGDMNSETGMYDYTPVNADKLVYGKDVSKYYTYTGNYAPPEGSSHNCYWKNTATQMCYCYDNEKKEWVVSPPPAFPNLKYAAVHLSRLFGVDEDRVHVSGFNDYANWNLDTVTESNESNAWSSAAQANTKANGEFTGITVYDNHVVCFKRDFMHEIYNNKNPFRLVDVYAEGSIDNRSIQEVDGKLIFVSEDEVKVYTGGNPRIIGYYLGIDKFTAAVSGSDGRNYYLYCEEKTKDKDSNTVNNKYLFVYDTFVEQWSQRAIGKGSEVDGKVLNFAHNKNGMYMLTDEGIIYKLDTGKYNHDWSFETDMSTSLIASSSSYPTVSVKHLSKLQMLAYIPKGSSMKIYALYDSENYIEGENKDWKDNNKAHLLWDSDVKKDYGMVPIRLKPRMTANYGFKLHFEGSGYVRLYEMELRTTAGGELFRDS